MAPSKEFQNALHKLYAYGAYSDLTVVCGDEKFHVHRNIVCGQSTWFEAACREDAFVEGKTGIINIPHSYSLDFDEDGDDPRAVKVMMFYFYHGNIDGYGFIYPPLCAKVFALAEKYDIRGMRVVALDVFERAFVRLWRSCPVSVPTIRIVYASVPEEVRGLKDVATKIFVKNSHTLVKKLEVQALLKEVPDFAFDVLLSIHDQVDDRHESEMPSPVEEASVPVGAVLPED